jgi:hypothetical protein
MTAREFKALAYSIGTSGRPAADILALAIQIANNLQWAGERRKVWLALVDKYANAFAFDPRPTAAAVNGRSRHSFPHVSLDEITTKRIASWEKNRRLRR